jgi:hypothetical protein
LPFNEKIGFTVRRRSEVLGALPTSVSGTPER